MNDGESRDEAFSELFEGFYDDLYRVAWRICGRSEVAEELCQEAFLRYYERRDRLPTGVEARYWLIRVVKNLAYNYEKRRGRERDAFQVFSRQPREDSSNEGEKAVLEEESRERVRTALESVPYKLRIALILKEYAGFPYAEIAGILKISESNVKVRVFRARAHLAEALKGDENVS